MKVVFNTGRLYQPEGQVITAEYDPETGLTLFMDHSRGIAGEVEMATDITSEDILARLLMNKYDRNQYRMSMDAMQISRDPNIEPRSIRL